MISLEEFINCYKKKVKLYFDDGDTLEGYCNCWYSPQDEDEEYMLDFGDILVNQSEVEKVEILE